VWILIEQSVMVSGIVCLYGVLNGHEQQNILITEAPLRH